MPKKIEPYSYDKDGSLVITTSNEAEEDWLRARRLKEEGTEEALKKLEEMENTPLHILDDKEYLS